MYVAVSCRRDAPDGRGALVKLSKKAAWIRCNDKGAKSALGDWVHLHIPLHVDKHF